MTGARSTITAEPATVRVSASLSMQPKLHKIKTNEYLDAGKIPVVDQGAKFIAGYINDDTRRYTGELPVIVFGDHTCCLKYVDFQFAVGADGTQIFCGSDGVDTRYLYYALHTTEIEQFGYQRHFKLLKECSIPLPSLDNQRRIASLLGAYDDLIEVNRRRVAVLAAIAHELFQEWFVRFRFPGNGSNRLIHAAGEPLPDGWQVRPIFDLATVAYGKNLPKKILTPDGLYPVYGAAKIIGRHSEFNMEEPTIICGCRGSVGEFQITEPRCFVTNNSFTFKPTHPDNYFWIYHALINRGVRDVIGGSAQPQITLDGISSIVLVTPPLEIRSRFQKAVLPIFSELWIIEKQIKLLGRARDLLLPRLISGEISVAAAMTELENLA